MQTTRLRAVVGLSLMFILTLGQFPAFAQDASSPPATTTIDADAVRIAIYPKDGEDGDRFAVEVQPGQSVQFTVVMGSFGTEPIELRAFTADVKPVINGGLGVNDRGTERHGSTLWMDFQDEEFTLSSYELREKIVTVTVPEDTPPGQYVNAIVLETVNPVNQGESSLFQQFIRKIVSVYIAVPGEVQYGFELGEPIVVVNQGRGGLVIPIANTGNTRIDVNGNARITSQDGSVVFEGSVILSPIYMGQSTYIQVVFSAVPPPGDYKIDYEFTEKTSGIVQGKSEAAIVVPVDETADDDKPIRFDNVSIVPNADPIVFANVSVDVVINGSAFRSTRLTLSVHHNGELVEDFVLAENLALNQGPTTVTQRYLPATNWESGTYSFSLRLESTDGGSTTLLLEQKDVATVEVP